MLKNVFCTCVKTVDDFFFSLRALFCHFTVLASAVLLSVVSLCCFDVSPKKGTQFTRLCQQKERDICVVFYENYELV